MSIEKLQKAFDENQPRTELTKEQMISLMSIIMSKNPDFDVDVDTLDKESEIYKHFKPLLDEFVIQVFVTRIHKLTTHRVTLGVLIFLYEFLKNPAICVMYSFYIDTKLAANTLITLKTLCENVFPWGMFSEEQLNTIWEAQKVRHGDINGQQNFGADDNLMDYKINLEE